jgi:hypothetical protein
MAHEEALSKAQEKETSLLAQLVELRAQQVHMDP